MEVGGLPGCRSQLVAVAVIGAFTIVGCNTGVTGPDDLGTPTRPMTYHEQQPLDPTHCWFNYSSVERAWTTPAHFTLECNADN